MIFSVSASGVDLFEAEERLPAIALADDFVFEAAQGEVGLREEVARTAGGVEEAQGGQPLLEGVELAAALALYLFGQYLRKLAAQVVEEERVDDAVDVVNGGVVHAASAPRLGVERALEDGAEDGGRYLAPVELGGGALEDERLGTEREGGDEDAVGGEGGHPWERGRLARTNRRGRLNWERGRLARI